MKKYILIIVCLILPLFSFGADQDTSVINIITQKIQTIINQKGEQVRNQFIATINNFKERAKNNLNERVQRILDTVLGNIQPKITTGNTQITNISTKPSLQDTTIKEQSNSNFTSIQNEMLEAVNNERTKIGLSTLKLNSKLNTTAQLYAEEIARTQNLSHEGENGSTVITRVGAQGYKWKSIGENLAMGTEKTSIAIEMWMDSPGHKANILNKNFEELGVGYHNLYRVQVFGKQ